MEHDLNDLYYFVRAVEHGGFSSAERALGIPKSRLSRRISSLEERLGVRLIRRSTRQFTLTDIGETYFEHCKAMLVEAEAAQDAIDVVKSEPRGIIRMACPIVLLHTYVSEILAKFMLKYPQVVVHLRATNRPIDLVGEGYDLALRIEPAPLANSELVMKILGERGQVLVGSPDLIRYMGGLPKSPADLAAWPSLAMSQAEQGHEWTFFDRKEKMHLISYTPRMITTDMLALKDAAIIGVGIVQLPNLIIHEYLKSEMLINILPDYHSRRELIHVVFPSRRGILPAVRTLIDFLAERFDELSGEI